MKRNLVAALTAIFSIASGNFAEAQWSAQVTGPDVFGNTTVVASVDNAQGDSFVIQCNQSDTLYLAFLTTATPSEMDDLSKAPNGLPASLLVKVDNGQVVKFDANLRVWNSNYIGVVTSGRSTDIVGIISAIGKASNSLSVGVVISGNQQSDAFDVNSSTTTIDTVVKNCKLDSVQSDAASPNPASH